MKKILSLILCTLMSVSVFTFTASASQGESPTVTDDSIVYDYKDIFSELVNKATNATVDKNATFDGRTVVKVTPTPDLANSTALTLDNYSLNGKKAPIPLPDYKYVGVTYYYDTDTPTYDGKLLLKYLSPMSCEATSERNIVTKQWDEAIFNLSTMGGTAGDLKQIHFRPFHGTNPATLLPTDVIYIDKITFYKKNPNPNAKTSISFRKVHPDAKGEDYVEELKEGEKLTLPENPFTFENAEFLGWKQPNTEEIIPAGTSIDVPAYDLVFEAQWKVSHISPDILSLDFSNYANGIVTNRDTGVVENNTEFDGKNTVQVTPNPAYEEERSVIIDGYNYNKTTVDLSAYNYIAIEYFYDSQQPVTGKQKIDIRNLRNTLSKAKTFEAREDIVTGAWAVSTFDISTISECFIDGVDPLLQQMWVYGFGSAIGHDQHPADVLYISNLMFFKDEPEFVSHDSYMNGYEDGKFKPSGTMTRAEACTVIARLLEKEENIAGTSAFADVNGHWGEKYIALCEAKGLLASYSGNFEPDKAITRAEFSELVFLTGLAEDKGITASFTDVAADHPKYASIMAAAKAGLINGYLEADNTYTFKPDNTITRAEVVTVINRARNLSRKPENLTGNIYILFLDVDSTHWAFADIAEATVPHVEQDNQWLYTKKDPLVALGEKIDTDALYKLDEGKAKVAELDELEQKRIEEIRNTPNMDLSALKGKKIYVSSSTGDNNNDGLTPETPVKTVVKANTLASRNDAVLFKRGDLWREKWQAKAGVIYTAYGEGAKPTFYGSPEDAASPEKWTLVHEDKETGALIWQYYKQDMDDVGMIVFNHGEGFAIKEIPSYNGKWLVRGKNETAFDWKKELDQNFEYVHLAETASKIINIASARGPLYFRCDNGNPGKVFDSLEFNTRTNVIQAAAADVTFDNLCVMYGGTHGIGSGTVTNLVVQNCEIGWIGGTIQHYDSVTGAVVRLGNGIEVYGGCDGYTIENCYVYECYDAGITHQISKSSTADTREDNILYKNNVITDCVYNIEYFLSASESKPSAIRQGDNVVFEGNLLRRAGFGFGSIRPDANNQRNIRSGNSKNEFTNYYIRNNILDRAVHELTQTYSDYDASAPVYEGNIYIQGIGNHLFENGKGRKADANLGALFAIQNVLGDKTAQMYFVDYIPKYVYSYTNSKTAEVTDEDRKSKAPASSGTQEGNDTPSEVYPEDAEGTEVTAPTYLATQKDKKLYKDPRASYIPEELVDNSTGIVFTRLNLKDDAAAVNMDCHGLPKPKTGNGVVYFKILMRTNKSVTPYIVAYRFKDAEGNVLLASKNMTALAPTKGDETWEEVIVKVPGVPEGTEYFEQIHLMPAGNVKGSSFFTNGQNVGNVYIDVAAWASFENLASAQAFDLKAAAVNGAAK